MKVLITGGLGYIGSHICVEFLENGYDVCVADNLSNSKIETKNKIEQIAGKSISFFEIDVRNKGQLTKMFKKEHIDAVVHCAGFKAVGESVKNPLMYFDNNLISTINLLECMMENNINNLIFSSSATVYGTTSEMPLVETSSLGVTNPYGRTKLMIEDMIQDICNANKNFKVILLRYFNPIGAHESGLIGEDPNGIPNNLMPYVSKVACGKLTHLNIFGNDYPTIDGTGVRDYIHVVDLAKGHEKAIKYFEKMQDNNCEIFNLGTGNGVSVLQLVNAYNSVCGNKVNYVFAPKRDGDIAECYCSPAKANEKLNWHAERNITQMCESSYKFEQNNKN